MKAEDARRKIALLRKVNTGNGAVPAEAETAVGNNSKVYIRLDENRWWVEENCPGGRQQTTARNLGVESLRKYLKEHAPRSYSFFAR